MLRSWVILTSTLITVTFPFPETSADAWTVLASINKFNSLPALSDTLRTWSAALGWPPLTVTQINFMWLITFVFLLIPPSPYPRLHPLASSPSKILNMEMWRCFPLKECIPSPSHPSLMNWFVLYNNSLSDVFNIFAPVKTRSGSFTKSSPWFTLQLHEMKA